MGWFRKRRDRRDWDAVMADPQPSISLEDTRILSHYSLTPEVWNTASNSAKREIRDSYYQEQGI